MISGRRHVVGNVNVDNIFYSLPFITNDCYTNSKKFSSILNPDGEGVDRESLNVNFLGLILFIHYS